MSIVGGREECVPVTLIINTYSYEKDSCIMDNDAWIAIIVDGKFSMY